LLLVRRIRSSLSINIRSSSVIQFTSTAILSLSFTLNGSPMSARGCSSCPLMDEGHSGPEAAPTWLSRC
jgi:hypothetical protein